MARRKTWPKGVVGRRACRNRRKCISRARLPFSVLTVRQHLALASEPELLPVHQRYNTFLTAERPLYASRFHRQPSPVRQCPTQFAYCNNDVWVPETTDKVTGNLSEPGILPVRQRYLQRTSDFVTEFPVVNSDVWVPKPTEKVKYPYHRFNSCALLPGVSPAPRASLSPVSSKVFASKSQCAHQCGRYVTGAACRTVLFYTTVKACFVCPSRPGSACLGLTGLDSRRISAVLP